ncbi:MAG: cytochrome c oxidase subunit, partial [Actinomycetota bacterium]
MPLFVWMTLVTVFLLLFAMPIITIALFLLMFDRLFGANFFNPAAGGDPLLWQHLFWLFGHPEVYILILPSMGMVSEILPVFARKPLFGYPVVVFSGIAIGFMGWGVWVHHMFATGLGPVAISAFSVSTMFIAVPTGVKIFNWLATCWGGSIRFRTAMLFAMGFIFMFTIGGLSGVTHAISPHDRQQTDTYYVVAHFHYVLFGGALFGIMGGLYYWWPKVFGHMLSEKLGKWHFWLWLIGFNVTFAPFHMLGLMGMPRRVYTYDEGQGWDFYNLLSTIGVFVIAASVLVFIFNIFKSRAAHRRNPVPCPADPWDGRTLEWTIPSPPPVHNFDEVPTVHALDDFWHRKYTEDDDGRLVKLESNGSADHDEHADGHSIHLPSPSYYPLVASFGLPVIAYGMIYSAYIVSIIGAVIVLTGLYAWAIEPSVDPEDHSEPPAPEPPPELGEGDAELVAVGAGEPSAEEAAVSEEPSDG